MGATNCACLDRDKEKERQKVLNEFSAPPPIQKVPARNSAIESYLNDKRRSNQFASINFQNTTQVIGLQMNAVVVTTRCTVHRLSISTRNPTISSSQDQLFLNQHRICGNIYHLMTLLNHSTFSVSNIINQKNSQSKAKRQISYSKKILVDQIFPNPFAVGEIMVLIRSSRDNLLLQDLEIHEQSFQCKNQDLCKLYFVLKCFLSENVLQFIGYYVIYERIHVTLKIYTRKLNVKLAKYNNIELQMIDNLSQLMVEEVINDRTPDSIFCQGAIVIINDISDVNILVMKQQQRQIHNINIIQLEDKQVNKASAAQDISKKINMLCTNDEFELIGLIPDTRNRQVLIMMCHQS